MPLGPLGDRIRELRTERHWSQGELAEQIGSDARQISRYEHGKITPSVEVVVKLAETFDVCVDYLLVEGVPRRPLHAADNGLGDRLAGIGELSDDDRSALLNVLDGLVAKRRLKVLAGELR
jgi:transcriptional regulator with XRE-family HTH domain